MAWSLLFTELLQIIGILLLLAGKLNDVKAVNLDNILWKFPEYGISKKIRNPLRSFNSINIAQQFRVMRKKGKENILKRKKKKDLEFLFVRNPFEKSNKSNPKDNKKSNVARPSWSYDDAFGSRSHQVRNQRASIGCKRLNNKLSDLKPCKSCTNCAGDPTTKLTISEGNNERNSNPFERFTRNPLKKLSGKVTFRSTETPVKTTVDKGKLDTGHNLIDNTSFRGHSHVGCGDGDLVQEIQTFSTGANPDFQKRAYDGTQYTYNGKLRRPRCQSRSLLSTLLRYILCGLITIVWSPCIITFLFYWFITYPLRPQPVGAPWQSGDNQTGLWGSFCTWLSTEVWPITVFQSLRATQSKSKSKFDQLHVPNLERKYSLHHESGEGYVTKPTAEKIIRHHPHIRDEEQTHFFYKHKNVNKVRNVKKRKNETIADFYNNAGRFTHPNEKPRGVYYEHFPLATLQNEQTVMRLECTEANEIPFSSKTVNFPHAFGITTVPDQQVICRSSKKRCKCKRNRQCGATLPAPTECGFSSIHYLPIMQPRCSDLDIRRHCRKSKVNVRCIPGQTCFVKRPSPTCKKSFRSCDDFDLLRSGNHFSHCGKRFTMCSNKHLCGDIVPVSSCTKLRCCRQNPKVRFSVSCHRNRTTKQRNNLNCTNTCGASNWNIFKSVFTGCHAPLHLHTLNRDLTTIRPYHLFFGPYNTKSKIRDFFSGCCRLQKSMCQVCLFICTFVVWAPVMLLVYIIYILFVVIF